MCVWGGFGADLLGCGLQGQGSPGSASGSMIGASLQTLHMPFQGLHGKPPTYVHIITMHI